MRAGAGAMRGLARAVGELWGLEWGGERCWVRARGCLSGSRSDGQRAGRAAARGSSLRSAGWAGQGKVWWMLLLLLVVV